MAESGSISFRFTADTAKFTAGVKQAGKTLVDFEDRIKSIGLKAGVAFAGLGYSIKKVVDVFAPFQAGMERAGAIMGVGSEHVKQLSDRALDLAKTTKFTGTEVSQAYNFMAMAGMDFNTTMASIEPTLQLAQAGALGLGDAANIVTGVMAGFGKQASELGGINDILAKVITSTKTDVSGLGQSFQKVGSIANAAGLEFREVAAALGLLGQQNMVGAEAGTALKTAIAKMLNPVGDAKNEIERLGISFKNSDGSLRSLTDIVGQFQRSGADMTSLVKIFGTRGMLPMTILVEQGAEALSALDAKLADSGGLAQRLADKEMATLSGALNSMKASVEAATVKIGEGFEPFVRVAAKAVSDFSDAVAASPEWLRYLIAGIASTVAVLSGVTAAVIAVGLAFNGLAIAIPIITALGASLRAAIVPTLPFIVATVAAVAGIAAAVGALRLVWKFYADDVKQWFSNVWGSLAEFGSSIKQYIKPAVKMMSGMMIVAAFRIQGAFSGAWAAIKELFTGGLSGAMDAATDAMAKAEEEALAVLAESDKKELGIFDGIEDAASGAVDKIKWVGKNAGETFSAIGATGKQLAKDLGASFASFGEMLGFGGASAPSGAGGMLPSAAPAKVRSVGGGGGSGSYGGYSNAQRVFDSMAKGVASSFGDNRAMVGLQQHFDKVARAGAASAEELDKLADTIERAAKAEDDRLQQIENSRKEAVGGVTDTVLGGLGPVGNIAKGFGTGGIFGGIMATITEVINASKPLQKIFGFVTNIFQTLVDALDPLFEALGPILTIVKELVGQILNPLKPVFQALGDILRPILGALQPIIQLLLVTQPQFLLLQAAVAVLTPVLKALAKVMEKVGKIIFDIANTFVGFWNGIVNAIAGVLKKIGNIEVFGKKPLGFMKDWAKSLESNAKIQEMSWADVTKSTSDVADEMAATADGVGDALANTPSGVKIALRRFQAIQATGAIGAVPGASTPTQATAGQQTSIQTVNVYAPTDFADMFNRMMAEAKTRNTAQSGPYAHTVRRR